MCRPAPGPLVLNVDGPQSESGLALSPKGSRSKNANIEQLHMLQAVVGVREVHGWRAG